MNLNTEPIKNWFGFSRRERRSNFTLLIIIVVIFGIRYTIPASKIEIEELTSPALAAEIQPESLSKDSPAKSVVYNPRQQKPYNSPVRNISAVKTKQVHEGSLNNQKTGSRQDTRKKVDINTSDSASLVELPGIGPVLSSRIIRYRNLLGGFASVDQLKEVYGLSLETFDLIKDRVTADSLYIKKININSAGFKEISHIRYLEKYEINSILKYRELNGKINSIQDLVDNKIITAEKASKVEGYVKFGRLEGSAGGNNN